MMFLYWPVQSRGRCLLFPELGFRAELTLASLLDFLLSVSRLSLWLRLLLTMIVLELRPHSLSLSLSLSTPTPNNSSTKSGLLLRGWILNWGRNLTPGSKVRNSSNTVPDLVCSSIASHLYGDTQLFQMDDFLGWWVAWCCCSSITFVGKVRGFCRHHPD